jgi:hypothetical protein
MESIEARVYGTLKETVEQTVRMPSSMEEQQRMTPRERQRFLRSLDERIARWLGAKTT